jgi:hypothetical protein
MVRRSLARQQRQGGNKLRTYRIFKKDCTPDIISRSNRRNLTRLRCGVLPLHVETGRFNRPSTPLPDRLCQFCDKIEDELHFLLHCPFYDDLRYSLLSKFHPNNNDILHLQSVMTSTSSHVILASTINSMFSRRMHVIKS